jgi:hypothetical protein
MQTIVKHFGRGVGGLSWTQTLNPSSHGIPEIAMVQYSETSRPPSAATARQPIPKLWQSDLKAPSKGELRTKDPQKSTGA